MKKKNLIVILLAPILFGCAAPIPQYSPPEGVGTANLRSDIAGAYDHNDSIDIYIVDGRCDAAERKRLFRVRNSKSDPGDYVKVPANRSLRLLYDENASGGRSCFISMEVKLDEGKAYSLEGGFAYESGPIPILTGTRMCRFGLKDDVEKKPVPHTTKCSE